MLIRRTEKLRAGRIDRKKAEAQLRSIVTDLQTLLHALAASEKMQKRRTSDDAL